MLNKFTKSSQIISMKVESTMKKKVLKPCIELGKYLLLLGLFNCFTSDLLAQDIITKKDGTEIQAKVTEVGVQEVKYTRYNTTTPVYSILRTDIFMIKFEDGSKELFNEENQQKKINRAQSNEVYNDDLYDQNQNINKYTFGNPINPVGGRKSPWGSGIASFFIPGLGQFINGDIGGGFLFLGSNIVLNYLWMSDIYEYSDGSVGFYSNTGTIALIGSLAVNVISIINAAQIAKKVNITRGYQVANNTYLQIQPTVIPQNNKLADKSYAYGMNFKVTF